MIFSESLGGYSVGLTNIPVYKMDGSLSGCLDFAMPDFGMVANYGYSTLVAPSYVDSARHNTGYRSVGFGKGAQYGTAYKLINRNESLLSDIDFHLPRLKIAGVLLGAVVNDQAYGTISMCEYIPDDDIQNTIDVNTSPDVVDIVGNGTIFWDDSAITQYGTSWSWTGLGSAHASVAPSTATTAELDVTKDLRFNRAGGLISLNAPINMGAGKLQFSNNYTVASAEGVNATWAGGGIEVDADKEVLWQVNGLASDALHKIGAGTLHVNA